MWSVDVDTGPAGKSSRNVAVDEQLGPGRQEGDGERRRGRDGGHRPRRRSRRRPAVGGGDGTAQTQANAKMADQLRRFTAVVKKMWLARSFVDVDLAMVCAAKCQEKTDRHGIL